MAVVDVSRIGELFEGPILIVSTKVGRGMYSLGEAIGQRLAEHFQVRHIAIEEVLPPRGVDEDLSRYRLISNKMPILLNLIYRLPIFYYRKYLRESFSGTDDLVALRSLIEAIHPRTVVCISHRAAFWVSSLKLKACMDFRLWGVLGEYGNTIGWRYIFWNVVDGFISPLERSALRYDFPSQLSFVQIDLPARVEFYEVADMLPRPEGVLVVCGYWGQGSFSKVVRELTNMRSDLQVDVVCGENRALQERMEQDCAGQSTVRVYGVVDHLKPFLLACGCVITKPGISTLLEARAARRKIFLLKGMPVAEDNNAKYAIAYFGDEWFTAHAFQKWYMEHLKASTSV
jgi:hypothetical protein